MSGGCHKFRDIALHMYLCNDTHMATNLQIDDALIREALQIGGLRTKRAVVEEALKESSGESDLSCVQRCRQWVDGR